MRFFRIPSFTGVETHRDDADRGSLRVVEGCVPHGPGGLRSGPIWKKVGDIENISSSEDNNIHAMDDGIGNSFISVSRFGKIHDITVLSTENTEIESFGDQYDVAVPSNFKKTKAYLTPIGDRLYAFGDGSSEAVYISKQAPSSRATFVASTDMYDQDFSKFPNCRFYVQGPKKTIFASGNPEDPLVVYISEPSGITQPNKHDPYSTEMTDQYSGSLSRVQILGSNATKITALSSRNEQILVHTDKGCHILYAPKADQAETGYRVEQAPSTNLSASVNQQVVGGEGGTQPFWLGHDGEIYKDESAKRGAEDFKAYADPVQANWKAKGQWEKEHPTNLSESFATFDPQSGMYWLYMRSIEFEESLSGLPPGMPIGLSSDRASPSEPRSLRSEIVHDLPLAPTITGSQFTPDPPLQPRNFDAQWIRPPDVPSNLESTALLEPSKPRFFTMNQAFIEPSTPTNLDPKSVVYDPPLVPNNLSFGKITPDSPAIPESFQISNFQRDSLFEFTFPSSWDGTTVGEHRKKMFEYAGARIQRVVQNTMTVEINVEEVDIDGSGGTWGSAGITEYVAQGMVGPRGAWGQYPVKFARPTKGFVRIDTNDIGALDYSTDPVFGLPSLYFVAMHELLHCLGLGNWWYDTNSYHTNLYTFLNEHCGQTYPKRELVPVLDPQTGIVTNQWYDYENTTVKYEDLYQFKFIFGFDIMKPIPDNYCEQYNGDYGERDYRFYFEQISGVNRCMGMPIFENHLYDIETPNVPSNFEGFYEEQIPTITDLTTYQQTSCYLNPGVAITMPCFRKDIFAGHYGTGDTRYLTKTVSGMLRDIGYTVDNSQVDQIPNNSFGSATINENCKFGLTPQEVTDGMQTQFNLGTTNSIDKAL